MTIQDDATLARNALDTTIESLDPTFLDPEIASGQRLIAEVDRLLSAYTAASYLAPPPRTEPSEDLVARLEIACKALSAAAGVAISIPPSFGPTTAATATLPGSSVVVTAAVPGIIGNMIEVRWPGGAELQARDPLRPFEQRAIIKSAATPYGTHVLASAAGLTAATPTSDEWTPLTGGAGGAAEGFGVLAEAVPGELRPMIATSLRSQARALLAAARAEGAAAEVVDSTRAQEARRDLARIAANLARITPEMVAYRSYLLQVAS